jgi:hypothetical protein
MVPPWVPDPPSGTPPVPPEDTGNKTVDIEGESGSSAPEQKQSGAEVSLQSAPRLPSIAPAARFAGARRSLGNFARTSDQAEMRRGVGRYVRNGYGGGAKAVNRFGGTASTADAIYGALSNVANGRPAAPGSPLDPALLAGRSAREVMDAVVEAVRPADGTQDAEAERASTRDALSELLTLFPDADLLNLTEEQRELATERFVAFDVYRRLQLDLGKTIQEKAPTAAAALARLKEVRDYVKETVAAAFRKLRAGGTRLTVGHVNRFVRAALSEAFEVFEGYMS